MTKRKPVKDLTDRDVAKRLFPKAVRDAVKEEVAEPPKNPPKKPKESE